MVRMSVLLSLAQRGLEDCCYENWTEDSPASRYSNVRFVSDIDMFILKQTSQKPCQLIHLLYQIIFSGISKI